MIAHAIVEGYRSYIDHRKDRYRNMKISSAFAWTKGNFIESKIAEICNDFNLAYKKAKAGLTWDYLQFIQDDTKKLIMIKNATYFNVNSFSQAVVPGKKSRGAYRTYLHELSKINQGLEFSSIHPNKEIKNEFSQQLSLLVPEAQVKYELTEFKSLYNEFHILTYKIDDAYQISKIIHYLPNPTDNKAYPIEDLSKYISGADERDVIAPEPASDLIDPELFDNGTFEDEERK